MRLNITEIQANLTTLVGRRFDADEFLYAFMEAYGAPRAAIARLRQSSDQELLTKPVLWKNKLLFQMVSNGSAGAVADALASEARAMKHRPRIVFVTNGTDVHARDMLTDETLNIELSKLNDAFEFFLPLAGYEHHKAIAENPADIKAANRLAKLHDEILIADPEWKAKQHAHDLNLFLTRLLFCFFAEDTGIFEARLFTDTVLSLSDPDGSGTALVIRLLFDAMNTPAERRTKEQSIARRFPYVNGGLFQGRMNVPGFSGRALRLFKECGELHWKDISPDIFGSMIQVVAEPELRADMGLHYTSEQNILKALKPLFLSSLREEFVAGRDSEPKLQKLLKRMYLIRVFDPACGSGNFLITAYRELRKLEIDIFERVMELTGTRALPMTRITLSQFCGIEITDFAAETAKLSLWIADYQMNARFKDIFGTAPPMLPLRDGGNIVRKNALRTDWRTVCPVSDGAEVYVVGNPPYLGSVHQTDEQKEDMKRVFHPQVRSYKDLDYVAAWLLKGAEYSQATGAECAFVATNSVCQGEQVAMLWPAVFEKHVEIGFAHQSFKWSNSAANNAGVTCVIVGLRRQSGDRKILFDGPHSRAVSNISPYLVEMDDTIAYKRTKPISQVPLMDYGNKPTDGGNLILSPAQRDDILREHPEADPLIRQYLGTNEFLKDIKRWCIWVNDDQLELAKSIPPIKRRIKAVKEMRLEGGTQAQGRADFPHRFVFTPHQETDAIIIPSHTSEDRQYLSVGLCEPDCIISNAAYVIYDPPLYIFAILSSRLHLIWTSAIGGHLESRYRYTNTLVYNTFPIPELSADQRAILERHAQSILGARAQYTGKTIARLYNPETMPPELLHAHQDLDAALEHIYIGRTFKSDEERLQHLFRLYVGLKEKSEQQLVLISPEHKPKQRKKRKR